MDGRYMKIVLMQPYFFPYIGYFTLIKHSDLFVAFDTAQYIRRGWVNRNRILGKDGEPKYINASIIKTSRETPINLIQLSESNEWKKNLLTSLEIYKNIAPHYEEVMYFVKDSLEFPTTQLAELNIHVIKKISEFLGINNNIKRVSELNIPFSDIQKPDDWGLQLSKAFEADTYINASGGQEIYNADKYFREGIKLVFYKSKLPFYDQKQQQFQEGLSIIDVMMFNSKEKINQMLDEFYIL